MLVRLDCLGCGARFADPAGAGGSLLPETTRLPDGALSIECRECSHTNLVERRGSQLVAVRMW